MPRFAAKTEVPVERSKAEIEGTVLRYGASGFVSGWNGQHALIEFQMKDRRVRFLLTLPNRNEKQFTEYKRGFSVYSREPHVAASLWEQACRQRWRALALAVKAKLEAVESGISTFEHEFLAHVVLASGLTLGETLIPRLQEIAATGVLPPLLPGPNH